MINPPLFTLKHYAKIIKVMRAMKPKSHGGSETWHIARTNEWQCTINALADMFARDNKHFKRDLFIAACNEQGAETNETNK